MIIEGLDEASLEVSQHNRQIPEALLLYLELPKDGLIKKVIHPVSALVWGRIRAQGRRERMVKQTEAAPWWGYFELPSTDPELDKTPLVYITSRSGGCEHQILLGGCPGCAYGEESATLRVTEEDITRQLEGDERNGKEGVFSF